MGGCIQDWNSSSHYQLVDYYKDYIARHPLCKNAYLSIMDQLIDDDRLLEAMTYCDQYAAIDETYRVPLYRGKIAWREGNREKAFDIWTQMEKDFPEEWCVYHNIADYLTRSGNHSAAEIYYRKAIDIQKAPRFVDPFDALAQLYERTGRYDDAIATLQEELEVFDKEWHFTTGETADIVHREIARLQQERIE